MVPIQSLFEAHLNVTNLERSVAFYTEVLGLPLAGIFPDRRGAFVWVARPQDGLLGLWEVADTPQRLSLHIAFRVSLVDVLKAVDALRSRNIEPLDFQAEPATEPIVLAWMPAAAIYFRDPDGNLIEFIAMLPDPPRRELGVLNWTQWLARFDHPQY